MIVGRGRQRAVGRATVEGEEFAIKAGFAPVDAILP
jgi:hypothetical protein